MNKKQCLAFHRTGNQSMSILRHSMELYVSKHFYFTKLNFSSFGKMVSFSLLRTVASRSRALIINATQQQRRNMSLGGHHGPPPEWTGVDKIVRSYLPEDYQRT
jgi:hypothetical protein